MAAYTGWRANSTPSGHTICSAVHRGDLKPRGDLSQKHTNM